MQRKTAQENCERLRNLDAEPLRRKCARFVADHSAAITAAHPPMPTSLNDRAADVWEPLIAVADLAGGNWPELARQAAAALTERAQDQSPVGSLLLDIFVMFTVDDVERLLSRKLIERLNGMTDRPWMELVNGRGITERWLSRQLRPYGIRPRSLRVGTEVFRGYVRKECMEAFRRYIPKSELQALVAEQAPAVAESEKVEVVTTDEHG